jgi:hypothetical protein
VLPVACRWKGVVECLPIGGQRLHDTKRLRLVRLDAAHTESRRNGLHKVPRGKTLTGLDKSGTFRGSVSAHSALGAAKAEILAARARHTFHK